MDLCHKQRGIKPGKKGGHPGSFQDGNDGITEALKRGSEDQSPPVITGAVCVPKPSVKFTREGRHTAHWCQFCFCGPLLPKPDSHQGKDNHCLAFIQQLQCRFLHFYISYVNQNIFIIKHHSLNFAWGPGFR